VNFYIYRKSFDSLRRLSKDFYFRTKEKGGGVSVLDQKKEQTYQCLKVYVILTGHNS